MGIEVNNMDRMTWNSIHARDYRSAITWRCAEWNSYNQYKGNLEFIRVLYYTTLIEIIREYYIKISRYLRYILVKIITFFFLLRICNIEDFVKGYTK